MRVNGPDAAPVYKFLKASKPGLFGSSRIKWNFTKFLVGKDGKVIERYGTSTAPMAIEVSFPLCLCLSLPLQTSAYVFFLMHGFVLLGLCRRTSRRPLRNNFCELVSSHPPHTCSRNRHLLKYSVVVTFRPDVFALSVVKILCNVTLLFAFRSCK